MDPSSHLPQRAVCAPAHEGPPAVRVKVAVPLPQVARALRGAAVRPAAALKVPLLAAVVARVEEVPLVVDGGVGRVAVVAAAHQAGLAVVAGVAVALQSRWWGQGGRQECYSKSQPIPIRH